MKRLLYNLIFWIAGHLPLRIISNGDDPYLERYYVLSAFGYRVYLHRFVASDPDRGWHDHPFYPCVSFVLWGEYGEEYLDVPEHVYDARFSQTLASGVNRRLVRWFNYIGRRHAHRVVLGDDWSDGFYRSSCTPSAPECWTLFIHKAEYVTPWGFWTRNLGKFFNWAPFDGKTGKATSGEWWKSVHKGADHRGRVRSHYAKV